MSRIFYLIVLLEIISCSRQNKSSDTTDTIKLNTQAAKKDTTVNSNSRTEENDCVFNNDYKGLTTSWLAELKITNFIWRSDLDQALIPRGQDTIFISQGGCVHFGIVAEIKLTNDTHSLNDSIFFVKRALQLATEFKMDQYERAITGRKIKKVQDTKTTVWYDIEDDNLEDNLFYNGIEITVDGKNKKISLSQYFN